MKRLLLTLTTVLFLVSIANAQKIPSHVSTDGLVAYYPFDGNANDASGNGNNGTVTDAVLTYDRFDNENSAYDFDGDGDYIVSTSNVGVGQTTITFSFWAKTASEAYNMVALTQDCGEDCRDAYNLIFNKFLNSATVCGDGHMFNSPQSFGYEEYSHYGTVRTNTADSGWNNYVLVVGNQSNYAFNNFKFYVNGIKQNTNCEHNFHSEGWQYNFPDYPLRIGSTFNGQIDDVAIWNRALSDEEINNLYDLPADILLNGTVSAENHQIKNVADPTDAQDAVTMSYVDSAIGNNSPTVEDVLTIGNDANGIQLKGLQDPTEAQDAATKAYIDALITSLQDQIDALQASSGSGTVTDREGNSYPYLTYGDQVWTVENAEMATYRDGTPIPQVTDAIEWESLTTGAWAYYNNDPTKPRLYNWYAVMGIYDSASFSDATLRKAFAPEGWHVPTDTEWTTLQEYLIANGYNYDGTTTGNKIGKAMASTTGWSSSTGTGTPGNDQSSNNSSGFNVFPEGYRTTNGSFEKEGYFAIFWTSPERDTTDGARNRGQDKDYIYLHRFTNGKRFGSSVRFVRD